MNGDNSATSLSLLMRIQHAETDEQAWSEFVARYGPRVHAWCLARGLQRVDADDVTQNILLKLVRRMRSLEYDPELSFRGWLRRVTENAVIDFWNERAAGLSPDSRECGHVFLDSLDARTDLIERLKDVFDLELYEQAMRHVQQRVKADRFAAWRLTAVDQLSGCDVSEQLGMPIASVYTAKNQIQQMIQAEIRNLDNSSGD